MANASAAAISSGVRRASASRSSAEERAVMPSLYRLARGFASSGSAPLPVREAAARELG
jgi:hypothetical protein